MFRRVCFGIGVLLALAGVSCDRAQLLAPTRSTVTLSAQSRVLPTGGSTEVSAAVIESSGTPVQNGTVVRFTTTLGRVEPIEAQTRNGIAVTTFFAGNDSGVAEVRGTSGGAGGTAPPATDPATTTSGTNMVMISVGGGAVKTVTVGTNPSVVSKNGGTVAVIALVVGENGRLLEGVPVTFTATRGTFSATTALTDAGGEARVSLTTNADTIVNATAGSITTTLGATVTALDGPLVTLSCALTANSTSNCATVAEGQSVTFKADRGMPSSVIASSVLDFGDGSSPINLGSLASEVFVSHTYTKRETMTARLTATDVNGETTSAVQIVQVVGLIADIELVPSAGRLVTATATVSPSTPGVLYGWAWGDGNTTAPSSTNPTTHTYAAAGPVTVSMTATLTDGRTVTTSKSVTVVP